jgi:subtilase family serine protease
MRNCKAVFRRVLLTAGLIGASIGVCAARDAVPYPTVATPRSVDRGELKSLEGRTPITVTVALGLKDLNGAESLMRELNTPGSAQYHQFLSAAEFETRFAPDAASVARAISALARYGLSAERATATTLHVTGLPADLERAFGVTLHSYEVPAHGNVPGYRFHAPLAHAAVPGLPVSSPASPGWTAVRACTRIASQPRQHPSSGFATRRQPCAQRPRRVIRSAN